MVFAHFLFFLYLLFSCHFVGNLASGCSFLGLLGPFPGPSWSIFCTTWLTNVSLLQRHFSTSVWVQLLDPKIQKKQDLIWGANGGPDALFHPSIPRLALLGPGVGFWCILGPSWGVCGALLGHPGAILGPFWAILRPSWGHFAEG